MACDAPAPPVVSKPVPSLDGEDRAIMKAVLDDFLKTKWDQSIQRSIPPVLTAVTFFVFDATLPVCEREEPFGQFGSVRGCIDAEWLEHLSCISGSQSAMRRHDARLSRRAGSRGMACRAERCRQRVRGASRRMSVRSLMRASTATPQVGSRVATAAVCVKHSQVEETRTSGGTSKEPLPTARWSQIRLSTKIAGTQSVGPRIALRPRFPCTAL